MSEKLVETGGERVMHRLIGAEVAATEARKALRTWETRNTRPERPAEATIKRYNEWAEAANLWDAERKSLKKRDEEAAREYRAADFAFTELFPTGVWFVAKYADRHYRVRSRLTLADEKRAEIKGAS